MNIQFIKGNPFFQSSISKLVLPESLEYIHYSAFNYADKLFEIEISPKNQKFRMVDKFLFRKSDESSKYFDALLFCRRNVENVEIPSYIKIIESYAFGNCENLKNLTFESGSLLETIKYEAISYNYNLKSIVFPSSLKYIDLKGIIGNDKLEYVEFLGQYIENKCDFEECNKNIVLSFPNAIRIEFIENSFEKFPNGAKLKILQGAKLIGDVFNKIRSQIEFIESTKKINATTNKKKESKKNEIEADDD